MRLPRGRGTGQRSGTDTGIVSASFVSVKLRIAKTGGRRYPLPLVPSHFWGTTVPDDITPVPDDSGPPPAGKRWKCHRGRWYAVSLAHPAADLFPWPSEDETDDMAREMADPRVGLKLPIRTLPDGRIIDGRSRELACLVARVNPRYEVARLTESEVPGFVLALNCTRRHLEPGQRAMVAAGLANLSRGRPGNASRDASPVSQADAADRLGVSRRSVQRAAVVVREGTPELADAARAGALDVNAAAQLAKLPAADQRAVAAAPDPKAAASAKLARAAGRAAPKVAPADEATVPCPLLQEDGVHWASGPCQVCDGRNRITADEFARLPAELREHAQDEAARAAAGGTGRPKLELPPAAEKSPEERLLDAIQAFAGKISRLVNETPDGSRVREYLANVGFMHPRSVIKDGKRLGWKCVGLHPLYRLVRRAAFGDRKLSPDRVRRLYSEFQAEAAGEATQAENAAA